MRGVGAVVLISLVFSPLCSFATSSSITQIAFTTSPQSVASGVLSGTITIQTQNAAGVCEKPDETVYLEFSSGSPTGEFYSSTGGDLDRYISKNTCNRNFTYKDSVPGLFTITVKATGKAWQISQQITIGSGGSIGNATGTNPNLTSTSGGSLTETIIRPQLLAGIKLHLPKQVSVHSPNYYWAETEHFEAIPDMFWNFGDGVSLAGTGAWHSYEHPGRYILSARAPSAGAQAVARSVVEVIEPKVNIASAEAGMSGFVELNNPGSNDLDISDYELVSGRRNFRIPEGTFIVGGGSTFITNRISSLGFSDGGVILNSPDGTRLAAFSFAVVPAQPSQGSVLGTNTVSVASLQKGLAQIHDMLVSMKSQSEIATGQAVLATSPSTATPVVAPNTGKIVVARPKSLFSRFLALFR
ncbi:MAG TPA: hypothetical protein VJG48_01895 [Candidatus Paceibacterota bacterium]